MHVYYSARLSENPTKKQEHKLTEKRQPIQTEGLLGNIK